MAEPKKRTNKSKGGMRRRSIKAKAPSISYCDRCHEPIKSHNVCKSCGYYGGEMVIDRKEKAEKDKD